MISSRELTDFGDDLRALVGDVSASLVLSTAPLSHAARVNAVRVPVVVCVSERDADQDTPDGCITVLACVELRDSSVECAAHVRENARATLLVESNGRTVHFYSRGASVVERSDGAFFVTLAALLDAAVRDDVRNFVVLRVDSIVESIRGVPQEALDRSIDGLPGLRSAAVARAYEAGAGKRDERAIDSERRRLSALQSLPLVDAESADGVNRIHSTFELLDVPPSASRRPSSLVQLDTAALPSKADTFSFAATALLVGFIAGFWVATKLKRTGGT